MPSLCFIILNWNGVRKTTECLESLLKNVGDFHAYVLDNGSIENEYEQLTAVFGKESKISILSSETNLGFTGGVNLCLHEAIRHNHDWYCLLNNDTEIPENFITETIDYIRNDQSNIGVFGPRILFQDNKDTIQSEGGRISLWTGYCPGINTGEKAYGVPKVFHATNYVSGCCFFIRKEVIENIGVLDDDFFAYYEEVDFCIRARNFGYEVGVFPGLEIYHDQSSSSKKYVGLTTFLLFRNRIWLLKKHASTLQKTASYGFLALYLAFIALKYGTNTSMFAIKGTWEGILSKMGNPFESHEKAFFRSDSEKRAIVK